MKKQSQFHTQHRPHTLRLYCLLGATSLFACASSWAQQTASPAQTTEFGEAIVELSPFTVTGDAQRGYVKSSTLSATRTNTALLDLAHTVQIVTKEQIEDMGIDQIGEAPRYVTNVDTRSAGSDNIKLRGFSSGQFFVDGTVSEGGGINGDRLQAFVERVEVVKGAAAVLYGAAPAGGIVNVVTVKPLTYKRNKVKAGFGDKGYKYAEVDSTGPLNADGSLRYRVTASFAEQNSGSHPYFGPAERRGIMPQIYFRPVEGTELLAQFSYSEYGGALNPQVRPYWNKETNKPWGLPFNWYRGEENDWNSREASWLALTWIQTFNENWHMRVTANYTDSFGIQDWGYTRGIPNQPDMLLRNFRHLERPQIVYNGQFDLTGKFDIGDTRSNFLLGGQLRQDETGNQYTDRYYGTFVTISPIYGATLKKGQADLDFLHSEFKDADGNPIPRSGTSTAYVSTADWCGIKNLCARGYAEVGQVMNDVRDRLDVKITQAMYWNESLSFIETAGGSDMVHLTAGGRLDYYRQTTTDFAYPDRPNGQPSRDLKVNDEDIVEYFPRYAALVKVTPQLSVYAMYSEAMKPVLGYEPTTGQKFLPEIAEQTEFGLKFAALDGRLTGSVSVFEIVRTNIKETDFVRFITVQNKEATADGWEIDGHFQVTDEFQFLAGYSTLNQEISASIASTYSAGSELITTSTIGDAVLNLPDTTGYLWAKYSFLDGPWVGFSAAIGGNHIGERFIEKDRSRTLPSYLVIDAMLQYRFQGEMDGLKIQMNVSNLRDEQIWTAGTGTFGAPGHLRRIRFHATYSF
jgi:iron complex outermembrane receptor protein